MKYIAFTATVMLVMFLSSCSCRASASFDTMVDPSDTVSVNVGSL